MGNRVFVFGNALPTMESTLESINEISGLQVVGAIQDAPNVANSLSNGAADVLVICAEEYSPGIAEMASEVSTERSVKGIVVVLTGTIDNAGVISLLKSGVNAIIPATASAEDVGIAIREASINRLFIPPRSSDDA